MITLLLVYRSPELSKEHAKSLMASAGMGYAYSCYLFVSVATGRVSRIANEQAVELSSVVEQKDKAVPALLLRKC